MNKLSKQELKDQAIKVREHIINLSGNGGCFIGASLSCADLVVYLYNNLLNVKNKLNDEDRDFFLLSKGHDVPALYGTFVEIGILDKQRLSNHLSTTDSIYWHPNTKIDGVEFHSGSLGHLPAVGCGIAINSKLKKIKNKIIVMCGDGELNEGSVWESLLVASALKLNNLTIIVDRNFFQANIETEKLIPLEPLEDKFKSFGCSVKRIDGHDFDQMEKVFSKIPFSDDKPSVIICDTVRGKGLPSIEARADRWFVNFSQDEINNLMDELHGRGNANLTSETLTVR